MSRQRARFGWSHGGSEAEARQALCRLGEHLYRRGWIAGVAGNVSLRLDVHSLLVTPRGVHKGFMHPSDLVRLDLADPRPEEVALASSELPFHRACHLAARDLGAALHTHAPALTALALGGLHPEELPPELEDAVGAFALVPFEPSGSERLAHAVGAAVRGGATVLLLQRHGVVTVGATLEETLDRSELAELGARAALLARGRR